MTAIAAGLLTMLSLQVVPNMIVIIVAFGLTAAQWAALRRPPPPGQGANQFENNVLRTAAVPILLFALLFLSKATLAIVVPRQLRLLFLSEEVRRQRDQAILAEQKRIAKLKQAVVITKANTEKYVSRAVISFLFHAMRNPLQSASAAVEELVAAQPAQAQPQPT